MLFDGIIDAIGHTPLVRLRFDNAPGVDVYAKLECQNLYGMKDRVARSIISTARANSTLRPGAPIVESSSGTMALGVALVGTAMGHPVHIVTDPRIDKITLAKLRCLGCEVHVVQKMTGNGWQSARLELLAQLREELPGAFWPDQYGNPDNPGAYRSLAAELLADLGEFDILVGSVGSGGSLCGTSRQLRAGELPGLRVIGVDSVGSVLFGQPDRPGRKQSGLGNSLMPANLDRRLIDEVHWLNDIEAFTATRDLAAEQQIFAGNTSGSVYHLLRHLAADSPAGTRIVGIMPDRGDRYIDTIYNDSYWDEHKLRDEDASRDAGAVRETGPATIRADQVALSWSRSVDFERSAGLQRLLFIESNTTGTGMQALRIARDLGLCPVLFTHDPGRYAGLAETGAEVLICETNDFPALRQAVRDYCRREEVAGVTTTSDFYLETVAELAALLGLPWNSAGSVRACRDKARTRALLAAAGVPQPRFEVVAPSDGPQADADAGQIAAAVARIGLPCVVKPVDDTGSNNVLLCATAEQAAAQVRVIWAQDRNARGQAVARAALVEEYMDGPEYSVETFSQGEDVHCVGITEKRVGPLPHFVEQGHVFPAQLPEDVAAEVAETARRAVRALGLTHGAAHAEVRLAVGGPAVIEVNGRLAGGLIPELIRLTTGTDMVERQLRAALGLPLASLGPASGFAAIRFLLPERDGVLDRVAGADVAEALEGVHQVTVTATAGKQVRPAQNAYDRLGSVIAHAGTADQAMALCTKALSELDVVLEHDQVAAPGGSTRR